jgi:FkbM family methyltransferase
MYSEVAKYACNPARCRSVKLERLVRGVGHIGRVPEIFRCRALVPEWKALTACYLGFDTHFPFTITLPTGPFTLENLSDVRTFWVVWFAGSYPVEASDRIIIDAGANIGTFTLFALTRAPHSHVIAIEPAPDSFDRLSRMISAHSLNDRCTLLRAGLGRIRGSSRMDLNVGSQFRRTGQGATSIDILTLPDVVDGHVNLSQVDLLKMDIEGAELDAISAPGSLDRVQRLSMEFHPPLAVEQITEELCQNGFCRPSVRNDGDGYGLLWASRTKTAHA